MTFEVGRQNTKMNGSEYDEYKVSLLSRGSIHVYQTRVCEFGNFIYKQIKDLAMFPAV